MGDEKIAKLLAKLEKLDPETYEKLSGQWAMAGTVFQYEIDEETKTWHTVRNYFAIIQGVIQDAIAKRGWHLDLYHRNEASSAYLGTHERNYAAGPRENIAVATLEVYVSAIEAEAVR